MDKNIQMYCFAVIFKNCHRFAEWEWEYYSGDNNSAPHGISSEYWQFAMQAFLAMGES